MGKILARQNMRFNNVKPDPSNFVSYTRHKFDKPYIVELAFVVEMMTAGFLVEVYEKDVPDPYLAFTNATPAADLRVRMVLAHDEVLVVTHLTVSSGPVEDAVFNYVVSAVHE